MRFWTTETWRTYKDDERWARLEVKTYRETGEDYFDILVGNTGHKAHAHIGISLDQHLLFAEDRGLVQKLGRKLESQKKALLEQVESIVDPTKPGVKDLILKINLDPATGYITVLDFGLAESGVHSSE